MPRDACPRNDCTSNASGACAHAARASSTRQALTAESTASVKKLYTHTSGVQHTIRGRTDRSAVCTAHLSCARSTWNARAPGRTDPGASRARTLRSGSVARTRACTREVCKTLRVMPTGGVHCPPAEGAPIGGRTCAMCIAHCVVHPGGVHIGPGTGSRARFARNHAYEKTGYELSTRNQVKLRREARDR